MTSGQEMRNQCEARLRSLVTSPEQVLAAGTADEFFDPSRDLGAQGDWRFLVVTTDRLLFADWSEPQRSHEEIAFDDVPGWSDGLQYHRYIVTLQHPAMTRAEHATAHHFLWFRWGDAFAERTRTTTTFRFSRRDTEAAKALRTALNDRNIPHEPLVLEEVSREERTRDSHVELRPE